MRAHLEASGQDELPLRLNRDADRPARACGLPAARRAADECPEVRPPPVDCPVGCRGTTGCLCGQGELSDNPLWIEND